MVTSVKQINNSIISQYPFFPPVTRTAIIYSFSKNPNYTTLSAIALMLSTPLGIYLPVCIL